MLQQTRQILSPARRRRLFNFHLPLIATTALIGMAGQVLHLPLELCLAAALAWQFLAFAFFFAPWRR